VPEALGSKPFFKSDEGFPRRPFPLVHARTCREQVTNCREISAKLRQFGSDLFLEGVKRLYRGFCDKQGVHFLALRYFIPHSSSLRKYANIRSVDACRLASCSLYSSYVGFSVGGLIILVDTSG